MPRGELNKAYDIAVVGSGFGGSLLAMIARRLGRSVILLEKGKHPRFAIGESSTPLSNILLGELSARYQLPGISPLAKWGSWQQAYPQISCGLKRGFTFYHHTLGEPTARDGDRRRQLLVAASPHDGIADTHWYRAEVDQFFAREAEKSGVEYLDEVVLQRVVESESEIELLGHRDHEELSVRAKFLVDATGPRGFLHHALGLRDLPLPRFPATQALFSHFTGVAPLEDQPILSGEEQPPYPVDDAAVHHVFDGGWIWVLRFNNGITSAGVAATDKLSENLKLSEGAPAWQRLLNSMPILKKQFAASQPTRPFSYMPRGSFRSSAIVGKRWAMLPSAAGFVDPLLSTGFPLTLLGVSRLAEIIDRNWGTTQFGACLEGYAARTDNELLATARLIGTLYATMDRFPLFASLSLLYFAAASYSEAARRLGKMHLADSFLLCNDDGFSTGAERCFEQARRAQTETEMREVANEVARVIEPFNIAGLGEPSRQNWYAVDANDLFKGADKLQSTREEITCLLEKCGFWK